MSKKKAQIEIKAEYIAIGKQFVGLSLRQKMISSTAAMLAENDTLTIYKTYIEIYLQILVILTENVLQVLPPRLSKSKWNNHTHFPLESSEIDTSSDDPRGGGGDINHLI